VKNQLTTAESSRSTMVWMVAIIEGYGAEVSLIA
jgi:hypothetical protein